MSEYTGNYCLVRIVFCIAACQFYLGCTHRVGGSGRRQHEICAYSCIGRTEAFVFVLRYYGSVLDCFEIFVEARLHSVEPCPKVEFDVLRRVCLSPVPAGVLVLPHSVADSSRLVCLAICRLCHHVYCVGGTDLAYAKDQVWQGVDRVNTLFFRICNPKELNIRILNPNNNSFQYP